MDKTQAENLRVLIRHMETGCARELDMNTVTIDPMCGTPGCALGEAKYVVFREAFEQRGKVKRLSTYEMGEQLFGLTCCSGAGEKSMYRIFGMSLNGKRYVSPQEWAVEARKVLAANGYSMDEAKPIPSVAERLEAIYAGAKDVPKDAAWLEEKIDHDTTQSMANFAAFLRVEPDR